MKANNEGITKYSDACEHLKTQHLSFKELTEDQVYQKLEEVGMFWDIRIHQWYMKDLEKGQKVEQECRTETTQLILELGWTSDRVDQVKYSRYGRWALFPAQWIDFRDYLRQVKTETHP